MASRHTALAIKMHNSGATCQAQAIVSQRQKIKPITFFTPS